MELCSAENVNGWNCLFRATEDAEIDHRQVTLSPSTQHKALFFTQSAGGRFFWLVLVVLRLEPRASLMIGVLVSFASL